MAIAATAFGDFSATIGPNGGVTVTGTRGTGSPAVPNDANLSMTITTPSGQAVTVEGNSLVIAGYGTGTVTVSNGSSTVVASGDASLATGTANGTLTLNAADGMTQTVAGSLSISGGTVTATLDAKPAEAGGGATLVLDTTARTITIIAEDGATQTFDLATFTGRAVAGTSGADLLSATMGDDVVAGLQGADTLYGNEGNDALYGNQSDDLLFGGQGNDLLFGGLGADTFVLTGNPGNETITDFNAAEGDRLYVTQGATVTVGAEAGNAVVLVGGHKVTLLGVATVDSGWIVSI